MDTLLFSKLKGLYDNLFHFVIVKGIFLGYGVSDNKSALKAKVPFCLCDFCYLSFAGCIVVKFESAASAVECREIICSEAKYGYSECFKIFKGKSQVKK